VGVNYWPTWVQKDFCEAEPTNLIERSIDPRETIVEQDHVLLLKGCGTVTVDRRAWGTIRMSLNKTRIISV